MRRSSIWSPRSIASRISRSISALIHPALALALLCGACSSSVPAAPSIAPSIAPTPVEPSPPAASAPAALDPPRPTLRLPRNFLPTSIAARLGIDPEAEGFSGFIELTGQVSERSSRFWLHASGLVVRSAVAISGDTRVPLLTRDEGDELLSLRPATPLPAGTWTFALQYDGRYEPVSTIGAFRQSFDDHLYVATQLESIYARRVFPCFDEPDVKIPWQLTLDVPIEHVAVANTPAVSETALDVRTRRVVFAPSKPLPSYLVAFGVGPYDIVDAGKTKSGTPVRILAFKGHAAHASWAAETSTKIVDALEEWFGTPYPYEKLDMLSIPVTAGFGAMENAGLITYAQRIILHDPKEITLGERYAWLSIAGHEVAHQWFGDLVTPAWWDDIWLNEGFARWMEPKLLAALEGKLPALAGKLSSEHAIGRARETALGADELVSARRIRQPIASTGDIFSAFDGITYDKGASVLAMFERAVGAEVVQRGVRNYLAAHRYGNATSADLVAAISAAAGKDLAPAFSSFLDQAGAPLVAGTLLCSSGTATAPASAAAGAPAASPAAPGSAVLRLEQDRYLLPGSPAPAGVATWRIPLCVAYERAGRRAEQCAELTTRTLELSLPGCPRWVMLNAGGRGYYRSSLPDRDFAALRDLGWKHLTPVERIATFSDVTALATRGEVEIGLAMSMVPKLVAEQHRFALAVALARVDLTRELVPPAQQPAYDAWVVKTFGPLARRLGWRARPGDRIDEETARRFVLDQVAWAGEPALRKGAVALAKSWRTLDASMRDLAWGVAADASPPFFEELLTALPVEKRPDAQRDMLTAVASVNDEPRLRSALGLLFDPRLDIRAAQQLLFTARTPLQRQTIAAYFAQHLQPLLARLPSGSATGTAARYAFLFTRVCDAARRDELVAFVQQHFGVMPDGHRVVAQAIESLDQCIAIKAARSPSAAAWIAAQK